MLKDYAKRSSYQARATRRGKRLLFFPIAGIVFAICFLAWGFIKYVQVRTQHSAASALAKAALDPKLDPTLDSASQPTEPSLSVVPVSVPSPQTQFDFYTLLPKMQIAVPKVDGPKEK